MRKIFAAVVFICLLSAGCSNVYAEREYDSADKIAQEADRYTKVMSKSNQTQEGYSLDMAEFDGRETLWSDTLEEDKEIEMEISFALSSGMAKVVHIDDEGHVTTIIECSPETSTDGYIAKTISFKSGKNRLKIVGYDCEDIQLELLYSGL